MVIKRVMQACTSVLALAAALYCGAAGAHGKVTMEEDTCMRRMGDNSMVHLSAYQPQYEPGDQYCTEIPNEVETFLVVDLVDQALRDIPVGMRIVRGTSEAEDETVTYVRPSYHPDGVIKGETTLDKGLYTVFITGDAVPPVHYQYPLRVRMINYTNIFRSAIGPLIVMMLLSLFAYKVVKSRRMRNWMDSRRR